MKPLKPRELERIILARGWVLRRSSGSHRQYSREGWPNITIPFHPGDLRQRTQESIMKQAGITRDEIENR